MILVNVYKKMTVYAIVFLRSVMIIFLDKYLVMYDECFF